MDVTPTTSRTASASFVLAVLGGAGHLASHRFHGAVLAALVAESPIRDDADLPDIVHLSYGLGGPEGLFNDTATRAWVDRNTRLLDMVAPDLVVGVCNTVQPALRNMAWSVLDNVEVLGAAVAQASTPAGDDGWVWLASEGAYTQGLFQAPAAETLPDMAALVAEMILAGMNGTAPVAHVDRLIVALAQTGQTRVVLACTDLSGYAPMLRARGIEVVDVVEELAAATVTTIRTAATPSTCTTQPIREVTPR